MKVLVVKLSALGDILHALPAVSAIRAAFPGAELGWVADRRYAGVLGLFPGIDHLHLIDPKGWGRIAREGRPLRALGEAAREIRAIRRVGYDIALDAQGLLKSAAVTAFSRARRRAGFAAANCREPFAARFYRERVSVDPSLPVDRQIFALAEGALGPLPQVAAGIEVPRAALTEGAEFLAQAGTPRPAVLALGAGWPTKVLPLGTWREVVRGLISGVGGVALLSGNAGEQSRAAELVDEFPRAAVFHRLPIPLLAGVLARARVVVGGDTGIIHLAALLGVPTVSYYGPSLGARSGPRGPLHRQVQAEVDCSPCFARSCEDLRCMPLIPAGALVAAAREVSR